MKIVFFDSNSLWVCARRMEAGRLHWPASEEGRVQLTGEEFALLIAALIWPQRRSGSGTESPSLKRREYRERPHKYRHKTTYT